MKRRKEAELDERGYLLHMHDLVRAYRHQYRSVKDSIDRWDEAETQRYMDRTGRRVKQRHTDTKIKKEMLEDLSIAIEWMQTGRCPFSWRGAERRGAYELEQAPDPMKMQAYYAGFTSRSSSTLSLDDENIIEDALSVLSEQERACYVMSQAYCVPFGDIANALAISKGTVQAYIDRAEKKLSALVSCKLQIRCSDE